MNPTRKCAGKNVVGIASAPKQRRLQKTQGNRLSTSFCASAQNIVRPRKKTTSHQGTEVGTGQTSPKMHRSPGSTSDEEGASNTRSSVGASSRVQGILSKKRPNDNQGIEDVPREFGSSEGRTECEDDDRKWMVKTVGDAELRILQHLNMLHDRISHRISGFDSQFSALSKAFQKLDADMSDLRLLTLKISATLARGKGCQKITSTTKKTLKEEIEPKHPTLSHQMDVAFSPHTFCRACAEYLASFMEACHGKQDDTRMTKRALWVIMYGLSTNQIESEFKSGLGKKHADFRFKIAKCCLNQARGLSEDAFRRQEQVIMAELTKQKGSNAESSREIANSIGKPGWLTSGIISVV